MPDLPHQDITYRVIGAAMKVHNKLGPSLKEANYHEALSAALLTEGLSFEDEHCLEIELDDRRVGLLYVDHFVEGLHCG
jgi:GxxExxY protein